MGKRSTKQASAKPAERIWPGTWIERSAEMLREDLEAAGIPYLTDDGVFDFHSFRHQFITSLAKNGVHPKLAQTLARHSTITLTMDRYSHVGLLDMTTALESLPSVPTPTEQIALATGTDDSSGCTLVALAPPKLTCRHVQSSIIGQADDDISQDVENPQNLRGNEGLCALVMTADKEWDRWDSNPEPKDYESGVGKSERCDAVGGCGERGVVVAPMVALAAGDLGCKDVMTRDDGSHLGVVIPPELIELVERWPMLSESVRRAVLALVDGSLSKPIEAALVALLEANR